MSFDTIKLFIVLLAALWMVYNLLDYLIPFFYHLPHSPARRGRIRRALEMANLRPGQTLYELGSVSARVLVLAARDFEAQAVGLSMGPAQALRAWVGSFFNGTRSQVQVRMGNFLQADLSEADVVFAHLSSEYAPRLEEKLAAELKPGARVVTVSFDFSNWEPLDFDEEELIFLYRMPPGPGGLEAYLEKHTR